MRVGCAFEALAMEASILEVASSEAVIASKAVNRGAGAGDSAGRSPGPHRTRAGLRVPPRAAGDPLSAWVRPDATLLMLYLLTASGSNSAAPESDLVARGFGNARHCSHGQPIKRRSGGPRDEGAAESCHAASRPHSTTDGAAPTAQPAYTP